jgi:predicted DNA binding CopG/RHH family protein
MAKLVQVNVRLEQADVDQVKKWAASRGWFWQELLRQLVAGAIERERELQKAIREPPKVK